MPGQSPVDDYHAISPDGANHLIRYKGDIYKVHAWVGTGYP